MKATDRPAMTRREFLGRSLAAASAVGLTAPAAISAAPASGSGSPVDIGSRRELFVDDLLIARLTGGAALRLHQPVPAEIVLVHDSPWEGSGSGYHSIFRDADLYRMYYKAWHLDVPPAGTALTESLLMASRDGLTFKRWNEAFLRPGIEREGSWNYGHQYIAWHLVETKSALEGAPDELSLYATESYWTGTSSALRRYTLRLDGFVSVNAPAGGGELVTKPLVYSGRELRLNFSTSAAGSVQVEIQDEAGRPLTGFALADCPPIFGDAIERPLTWDKGADLGRLSGRPVRLRFVLRDADLFAFRFFV